MLPWGGAFRTRGRLIPVTRPTPARTGCRASAPGGRVRGAGAAQRGSGGLLRLGREISTELLVARGLLQRGFGIRRSGFTAFSDVLTSLTSIPNVLGHHRTAPGGCQLSRDTFDRSIRGGHRPDDDPNERRWLSPRGRARGAGAAQRGPRALDEGITQHYYSPRTSATRDTRRRGTTPLVTTQAALRRTRRVDGIEVDVHCSATPSERCAPPRRRHHSRPTRLP